MLHLLTLLRQQDQSRESLPKKSFPAEYKKEIRDRFIAPSLAFLIDNLEDIPKKSGIFSSLTAYITQPKNNYPETQRKLSIRKDNVEADEDLLKKVIECLPDVDEETSLSVYRILFTLLHEYRFNKNPDKPFSFDPDAQGVLSKRVKKSLQQIAQQLNGGESDCEVQEFTPDEMDEVVTASLREIAEAKLAELKEQEQSASTVEAKNQPENKPRARGMKRRFEALLEKIKPAASEDSDDSDDEVVDDMPRLLIFSINSSRGIQTQPTPSLNPFLALMFPLLPVSTQLPVLFAMLEEREELDPAINPSNPTDNTRQRPRRF